jgi:hypothetical protein
MMPVKPTILRTHAVHWPTKLMERTGRHEDAKILEWLDAVMGASIVVVKRPQQ